MARSRYTGVGNVLLELMHKLIERVFTRTHLESIFMLSTLRINHTHAILKVPFYEVNFNLGVTRDIVKIKEQFML